MKAVGKIYQKFKQLKFRYMKKFIQDHLDKKSSNCVYNRPTTFSQGGCENVCLCGLGFEKKEWLGGACDDRVTPEISKNCLDFEPLYKKDDLKKVFNDFLEQKELEHISKHYPDLATLIWVLGEVDIEEEESSNDKDS